MENTINTKKVGIRELFKHKSFITMLIANLISRFGDSVDSIAYGWMVYTLTGSKLLLGTIFAINAIPGIIFSPFVGVLVDHFPKKKLIIIGDVGRGVVVSLTALLFLTNNLEVWHLFVFTFMNSTFEAFVSNSKFSLIPSFLPDELILSGSSFSKSLTSFGELLGVGLAGLIIATLGIPAAIFIDGLTFFISSVLVSFLKINEDESEKEQLNIKTYFRNLKEGFIYVKNDSLIFITILLAAFANFCLAPISILLPAFVKETLKGGANGLSLIAVGLSVGMIVGGIITSQFGSRITKGKLFVIGMSGIAICYTLLSLPGKVTIPLITPLLFTAILFFLMGLFMPVAVSPLSAHILTKTPRNILGRVGSLMGMLTLSAMPLGGALTGLVSQKISMNKLFLSMGIIMFVVTLLPLFNKDFRNS